ncbi:class I SAM-dependent methyltransferase [Joostella sp. CR20]|uniref:class I SAM-dependent methyltransferase n=1 Tax=Joostella sp. CR20 TaxID=2804312 RepID=UPI00313CA24D
MQKDSAENSIASQLKCPSGSKGIEMGEMMHATNIGMTRSAIKALNLNDKDEVLEIGHGNAKHLNEFFQEAKALKYVGVDISEQMHIQAKNFANDLKEATQFYLYNGINLPFEADTLHKVFTVNTIYFWSNPTDFLNEIYKVLKPSGLLSVCFAEQSFMEQLPFIDNQFELYDEEKVIRLIGTSDFLIEEIIRKSEVVTAKDGTSVTRDYLVVVLKK